ncbi:MAG: SMC-Scp complex subunit ScpB [Clostridiales bacterium]|nr:SMC-Scp complex subunit ScpB [Clostridiales bacterium]
MEYNERLGAIECILFVSGDPVPIIELQRAIGVTDIEMEHIIRSMDELYKKEKRGVQLFITPETMQLVSNKEYAKYVEELVQPVQAKSFSQAMLETLSVIAYRQPVTRADIEAVRGVRCEYAVSQLMKMGMIRELGRKNVVGRPMLLGTTDAFLRHFGIRSLNELPSLGSSENAEIAGAEEAVPADTDIETAEAEAGLPA